MKNKDIDKTSWDACIDLAKNGLIYGYSWYLDIFAENWDALVYEDYSAVMPLIWNQKFGLKYIYQPLYLQQSGVFSKHTITESELKSFINCIPKKFKTVNINLNSGNKPSQKLVCSEKVNFELKLSKPYSLLQNNFNKNTKRNVRKAEKAGFKVEHHASFKELVSLKKEISPIKIKNNVFIRFGKLIEYCKNKNCSEIYTVKNQQNKIISVVFFSLSHNRAYYIFAATNKEGKETRAAFLSVNEFIKDHADQNMTLDFEGSMIPGIARFFEGWGAQNVPYYNFKQNKLPLLFKLFKK